MNCSAGIQMIKARSYIDGKPVSIDISGDRISRVEQSPPDADNPEIYVAPGLVDIQVNGYMGVDFADTDLTVEKMRSVTKALWKEGVTSYLPTLISAGTESLIKSLSVLSFASEDTSTGISIPGFHLEGPYISPECGFRGAHLEKYIRKPDWNEFLKLHAASKNRIKIVTLAPEMPGATFFIEKCVSEGITAALGHHNGNASEIAKAADAGAALSTHLGNGCANTIDRHNNPLWPQLADDRLAISIIADGFHLTREEILSFYRIKGPGNTVLVSDTVDLAGLAPGEYRRGERSVLLTGDAVTFPSEGVLAGATSPLVNDVSNMIKTSKCSLAEAVQMASTNPARLAGLNDRGEIKAGKRADLILFTMEDEKILIQKTIVAGTEVYPGS